MGVINEELDLSIDSIDNGTADTTVDNGSDTTTITNPPAPEDKGSNEGNNQQSSSTGEDTTTQTDNNTANNNQDVTVAEGDQVTIDDIRKEIVETVEDGQTKTAIELLGDARYKIFDAIVETDGFAFIAVGRPESAGCYCKINTYLKEVINLISGDFDYVVIDGEAGIEQINRRVMEKVTHLLLVSDASKKGTQVINTIKDVADKLVMYDEIGAIINRIPDESVIKLIDTNGIEVLSYIPVDSNLAVYDIEGKNITKLPDDSNIVKGTAEALEKIGIL